MAKFFPTKSDSVFTSSANKCAAKQNSWSRKVFSVLLIKKMPWYKMIFRFLNCQVVEWDDFFAKPSSKIQVKVYIWLYIYILSPSTATCKSLSLYYDSPNNQLAKSTCSCLSVWRAIQITKLRQTFKSKQFSRRFFFPRDAVFSCHAGP